MDNFQQRAPRCVPRSQTLLLLPGGSHFTIQTDHQALVSAAANAKPRESAREVRHLQYLSAMRPTWEFITGASNNTADALSRATPPHLRPKTTTAPAYALWRIM